MKNTTSFPSTLRQASPWFVLIVLVAFTYARFFVAPYPGFFFTSSGVIDTFSISDNPPDALLPGDQIVQIGDVTWKQYMADVRQPFFSGARPGDRILIRVERSGQPVDVLWIYPGMNTDQFFKRLGSQWVLTYVFWLFGTLAFYTLRPKDRKWQLMVAANYLMSIWLMMGTLSASAVWHSAVLMRMATWLGLPVYLHLHWIFPKPLGNLPRRMGQAVYVFSALMALAEWFQLLPTPTYALPFLLTFLGSVGLLATHAIRQPEERRSIGLLAILLGAGILPSLLLAVIYLFGTPERAYVLALPGLAIIPAAYLYVAYRRSLGTWELRANRAITLFLYTILLITAAAVGTSGLLLALDGQRTASDEFIMISLFFSMLLGLASAGYYPNFQHWVETNLLKIPLPSSELTNIYAKRITASLEMSRLVQVLEAEILPSMLVRQSALLRLDERHGSIMVYASGQLNAEALPAADDPILLSEAGVYRSLPAPASPAQPWPWVRLALPLRLGEQLTGMWLLGRRDPDDFYAQTEIKVLSTLADQTAIALSNILQMAQLQELYRANVGRDEAERGRLAQELHDDVLGQMALLALNAGETGKGTEFQQAYQGATGHIRSVIHTLRPPMLNYGLRFGLDELLDELQELAGDKVTIQMTIEPNTWRYPLEVEAYLYRIVQQAGQNALRHAQAGRLSITGQMGAAEVMLSVQDDGIGFETGPALDLAALLAQKHYGLAGMYERAAAIGAQLTVLSEPSKGTRVTVVWRGSVV